MGSEEERTKETFLLSKNLPFLFIMIITVLMLGVVAELGEEDLAQHAGL